MTYTATYSPEDNKLGLYSSTRLDRELYAHVRGAGTDNRLKHQEWTDGV
jgi:hypothetical protein